VKKIKVILIFLLIFIFSGCSNTNKTSSLGNNKELVVVSWGGTIQDAQRKSFFEPFEKKYGVKIKEVSPPDYGKLKAMVNNGKVEWDVVDGDSDFAVRGGKQNLLEPLDFSVIDKTNLIPSLTTKYSVGAEIYTYTIAYNTKSYPTGKQPKTWNEFWDVQKYPGARALWKWPVGTLEIALLADGVVPKSLYPLDLDRAFKSLDKIKKNVNVWWTTGAQSAQLLSDKEVDLEAAWNGRIQAAKRQGANVDVEFNQALLLGDSWFVPKGAPHKDLAMKFIAFVTSAERQAEFVKLYPYYGPVNTKAYDLLDEEVKKALCNSPDKLKNEIEGNETWWGDNFDRVNERFQKWLLNQNY
jgi:putative spermidine/putrescine transport system substrate-binding protein